MDQILASIQKLELAVNQNANAVDEKLKVLDARLDAFQRYYFDLEKQRTVVISNMMSNFVSITNTVAQLLQTNVQPKHNVEPQQMLQYQQQAAALQQQALLRNFLQQQSASQNLAQGNLAQQLNQMNFSQPQVQPQMQSYAQPNIQSTTITTTEPKLPQATVHVETKPVAPTVQTPQKVEDTKPAVSKSGFGDKFTKKAGEWDCQGCYVRNKPEIEECVSCGTTKDGKPADNKSFTSNTKPASTTTSSAFSFGIKAPTSTPASTPSTQTQTPVSKPAEAPKANFSFQNQATKTETTSTTATTTPAAQKSPFAFNFGNKSTGGSFAEMAEKKAGENKSTFGGGMTGGSLFGGSKPFSQQNGGPTFASMANQSNIFGSNKDAANKSNTSFGATTSNTLFKNTTGGEKDNNEEESPEDFVPDAHYEPVIPLPEKVDAVTGEEEESVLFETNCKLYVFVNSEIKERGRGPMRVLLHPSKKTTRVVMRRDQVLKICANFPISKGMAITDKPNRDNIGLVNAVDFSEDQEGQRQVFLFKFDNATTYQQFKKLFNDCVNGHDFSKAVLKSTTESTSFKEEVESPHLPDISSNYVNEEEENDEEGEDYEDYNEDEDAEFQVVYEVECSVTAIDEDDKSNVEKYDDTQLVITTTDDVYFKVFFDLNDNSVEEYVPHWIDDSLDIKHDTKKHQISYTCYDEFEGVKRQLQIQLKTHQDAKKVYDLLKAFQESYIPYDQE